LKSVKFAYYRRLSTVLNFQTLIRVRTLACLVLALGMASNAYPQDIVVRTDTDRLAIAEFVDYYEDASEALGIDDVLASDFRVNFIPHDRDILHFGMTSSAYWIRFSLDWSRADGQSRVLELGPPQTGCRLSQRWC
jgi:hypothetical protein